MKKNSRNVKGIRKKDVTDCVTKYIRHKTNLIDVTEQTEKLKWRCGGQNEMADGTKKSSNKDLNYKEKEDKVRNAM